ncbi:MAG TPA: endonuclease Q family protein [Candidatus Nanoarchaeia archaeon]|nr:endonuclease Q family protein [Candidatus Nanoarchaeia archaeon]
MKIIADLHIHSKYSRACSSELTIPNLEKWARIKGLSLLGTGDFSHPKWQEELKKELKEDGTGILRTSSGFPFVLQNEVSLIYTQKYKGRRIHLIILAPSFDVVDKITAYLKSKGRVDYDGRPIFNISCEEFSKAMMNISEDVEIIPAHAWTPWFGIFGSMTGFDSIEEAFGSQAKNIHALESGLSSDPEMNWRLTKLDNYRIVSFSDSHSFWPWRIGREATVFNFDELTYQNLIKALRTGESLVETLEVDPNYGKYHFDGHRNCGVSFSPEESKKLKGICPVCKRPLTIGVLNRVDELADRKIGEKPANAKPFKKIIPLHELLALVLQSGMATKKVWAKYYEILKAGENEFDILLNVPEEKLLTVADKEIVDLIMKNRRGELTIKPGYDGEYGVPVIEGREVRIESADEEKPKPSEAKKTQTGLGDYF